MVTNKYLVNQMNKIYKKAGIGESIAIRKLSIGMSIIKKTSRIHLNGEFDFKIQGTKQIYGALCDIAEQVGGLVIKEEDHIRVITFNDQKFEIYFDDWNKKPTYIKSYSIYGELLAKQGLEAMSEYADARKEVMEKLI